MSYEHLEKLGHEYVGKITQAIKNHEGDVHRYFISFHQQALAIDAPQPAPVITPDPVEDAPPPPPILPETPHGTETQHSGGNHRRSNRADR